MTVEPVIGLIIPPPDLRNIVDKTASFVARNGPEFELRIQQNEQNNPKFNFLKAGDPYNSYYQFKVKEIREGNVFGVATTNTKSNNETNRSTTQVVPNQIQAKMKDLVEKAQIIPQEPPPDFEFLAETPSLLALDLDIIKLTAQFVAIHGRSFLTNLMNREQRNYQFDFLRPQHGLFNYFTQLIEQYTKILNPSKNIVSGLKKELDTDSIMNKIKYRLEWTKIKEAEKRKELEEIEKERVQYAQIDWHDFVIVETVDYQLNEQGLFPPPTTPEQVGSRILLQQRIEEQNTKNNEMDVNSDEKQDQNENKQDDSKEMPPPAPLPPLPTLDNVTIRKDYNPKQAKKQAPVIQNNIKGDGWVISPITNEKIPAEKLAEHMRYGLLDPRWVEQREKAMQEKMQQEEVYAPGVAIENSLKQMAERRTDIFGSGIAETDIGKKISEEIKKPDKVTWDGYTSSMEAATRAARANISIEDQIQQIHKIKGLVGDDSKDKIGPTIVSPNTTNTSTINSINSVKNTINNMPQVNQVRSVMQNHNVLNNPSQQRIHPNPQLVQSNLIGHPINPMQHLNQHLNPQQFHMGNTMMMGLYPVMNNPNMIPPPQTTHSMIPNAIPNLPFSLPQHPQTTLPEETCEPSAKKMRTEDNLIPEEEFLAQHSGSINIKVVLPNYPDKPELKLNGQILNLVVNLTDMISSIKSKVNEQIGLAPSKQKLQYEGIFVKDSNTFAFYNMEDHSLIQLALKERGGRKK